MQPSADDAGAYASVPADNLTATSTDTSSDNGSEEINDADLVGLSAEQASEQIYWQYRQAKKRWRRHTSNPVRRVRRFVKRKGGKGKGGKRASAYIAENPDVEAFFKGRSGKGGRGRGPMTTGKGFGRKGNPKGSDGTVMKYH